MPPNVIAIIPARGGSKGIPRKNVRPLAGRPLLAYAIEAARRARRVSRVVVSTDDPEIASVAAAEGAEAVMRPADLSGDRSASEAALLHVIDSIEAAGEPLPDVVAFLQCTSPLTLAEDVDGTLAALDAERADCAFTVTRFHHFVWGRDAEGAPAGLNHDARVRPMRQQRAPQYLETGAVYAMRTAGLRESGYRFFGRVAMHEVPADRTLEIDEPADFLAAERAIAARRSRAHLDLLPSPPRAVVFDFDGVMTDNRVWVHQDGQESVACSRGDGLGIDLLRRAGVPMLVLSKERNPVVAARCAKLRLPVLQGVDEKPPALARWLGEQGVSASDAVYVGNDVNDLECLRAVGCGVVVADAHPAVISSARIVLSAPGGLGAVRELADLILQKIEEVPSA